MRIGPPVSLRDAVAVILSDNLRQFSRLGVHAARACQKYDEGRVEAICQSALAFDVVSVPQPGRRAMVATHSPAKRHIL